MVSTRLRVKELLKERRWTTKVLAEKTGMSESYLTHIKNSTRRWNEDALKKLSEAFQLEPTQLFELTATTTGHEFVSPAVSLQKPDDQENKKHVRLVPVMGEIPAQPSEFNNVMIQTETGYSGKFMPIVWPGRAPLFCLHLRTSSLAPTFSKGDYLIIAPDEEIKSGDTVAIEYGKDELVRTIVAINFTESIIVLEALSGQASPIALVKNKDHYRIIGKVIYRYQKIAQ